MGSNSAETIEVRVIPTRVIQDTIYVAVGKYVEDSKYTLKWALQNSGGRKICIIHVHKPAEKIPILGTKFRVNQLQEHLVREYHATERENMLRILGKYCAICQRVGVRAETVHIEMDSIEKGIIELIIQCGITKLVMGAAADKQYSKKMLEPKSKKSIYVRQQAPVSCHISFVCKGNLVCIREAILDGLDAGDASRSSLQPSKKIETGQTNSLESISVTKGRNDQTGLINPVHDYGSCTVMPDNHGMITSALSSPDCNWEEYTPRSRLSTGGGPSDDWNGNLSNGSCFSTRSSTDMTDDSTLISYAINERGEIELEIPSIGTEKEFHALPFGKESRLGKSQGTEQMSC